MYMCAMALVTGLILASEPYYNEAGYEKQRGSQQGAENSRLYNEMVSVAYWSVWLLPRIKAWFIYRTSRPLKCRLAQ